MVKITQGQAPKGITPLAATKVGPTLYKLYRGMSLMELRMIIKFGKVVSFENPDNARFSEGLDERFQVPSASRRRTDNREVLIQLELPESRFMVSGYAHSLVRKPTDTVPDGYVEELEQMYADAVEIREKHEEAFSRAKEKYKGKRTDWKRRMQASDPEFWSQPEVVAWRDNEVALKRLPGLIVSLSGGSFSRIAVVDARTINWDSFETDNRAAFTSTHDLVRYEKVILPLVGEGKRRWG